MVGGGCHRRKGGGFSGLNTKPATNGQLYLTTPYTSQGFQNYYFRLDAMNIPRKSISGDTVHCYLRLYLLNLIALM